jgi:hypothetical protein
MSIRTAPAPQRFIIGMFFFLLAVVLVVAPIPLVLRSLGVLLCSYLAFSAAGMSFAYLVALLAPPVGLLGDGDWLVMLPIVLASGLLAMLGLEYAWRYAALVVSPLLCMAVPLFVALASQQRLFAVDLPWGDTGFTWVSLHGLTALAGMLIALSIDRRRERKHKPEEETRRQKREVRAKP